MGSAPLRLTGSDLDFDRIFRIYDELGPIPRLCIDKLLEPHGLKIYRDELSNALGEVSTTRLEEIIRESAALSMGSLSSKICLIRRVYRQKITFDYRITPITDDVGAQINARIQMLTSQQRVHLYKTLSYLPSTRVMAGKVFEPFCQLRFQSRIHIKLISMVRLSDPKPDPKPKPATQANKKRKGSGGAVVARRAPRPQWHSSHTALHNEELETMRQTALRTTSFLDVRPLETRVFTDDDLAQTGIRRDIYYIPKKQNQVGLDAFIVHRGIFYMFQFTVGHGHGIKDGLLAFLARCTGLPSHENWRFVFIIPADVEAFTCPVPCHDELQNLRLFSSVVAVEMPEATEIHGARECVAPQM
jgi:hypothetical protein